jgi:hypothetical protein
MNQLITHDLYKPNIRMRMVNSELTKLIISCHEQGYTEDFFIDTHSRRVRNQASPEVDYHWFTITVVNQCYDSLTQGYKYIHTVETLCGIKGLLVCPNVQFNC